MGTLYWWFTSHKDDIAQKYVGHPLTGDRPNWINELKSLCDLDVRR